MAAYLAAVSRRAATGSLGFMWKRLSSSWRRGFLKSFDLRFVQNHDSALACFFLSPLSPGSASIIALSIPGLYTGEYSSITHEILPHRGMKLWVDAKHFHSKENGSGRPFCPHVALGQWHKSCHGIFTEHRGQQRVREIRFFTVWRGVVFGVAGMKQTQFNCQFTTDETDDTLTSAIRLSVLPSSLPSRCPAPC